jgi:hypothetical protein
LPIVKRYFLLDKVLGEGYSWGNWEQMNAQHETLNAQLSRGRGKTTADGQARTAGPAVPTILVATVVGHVLMNGAARYPHDRHRALQSSLKSRRAMGAQKHAFLRNEPDWQTRNYEWMWQGCRRLGCAEIFFQSGSFQFVMLMPIRITLRASKLHEAVCRIQQRRLVRLGLRLPEALGLAMKWTRFRETKPQRESRR